MIAERLATLCMRGPAERSVRGIGIVHIVSIRSPGGGEHHAVLDCYEGVATTNSTVTIDLGQITGEIAERTDAAGYPGTAPKLRVAASVFCAA